jgi:hypothetical protein
MLESVLEIAVLTLVRLATMLAKLATMLERAVYNAGKGSFDTGKGGYNAGKGGYDAGKGGTNVGKGGILITLRKLAWTGEETHQEIAPSSRHFGVIKAQSTI